MAWILWLLGLVIIAVGTLAAMGALGQLDEDDDFANASRDHIPLQLFGYRRDVVDRLLDAADSETNRPE